MCGAILVLLYANGRDKKKWCLKKKAKAFISIFSVHVFSIEKKRTTAHIRDLETSAK